MFSSLHDILRHHQKRFIYICYSVALLCVIGAVAEGFVFGWWVAIVPFVLGFGVSRIHIQHLESRAQTLYEQKFHEKFVDLIAAIYRHHYIEVGFLVAFVMLALFALIR